MDALYVHARFDDLDLDARSQCIHKGKTISGACSRQAISIKLATAVGHFLRDLDIDLANVHMACPSCGVCVLYNAMMY